MDLWGGIECTVNRLGGAYRDQTRLTGHHDRIEDLAKFSALGLKKIRYPVLWERVSPKHPLRFHWSWSDQRLAELARFGIEPIVGLVHHGSGPLYTNLLADNFAASLGRFAGAVARRYPHVTDWVPVNEPLTTARFSALYGHWYPHLCDEQSFWIALLNQIDGTRLAMSAIRRVNPAARLIQTEDLGQTYSTPTTAGIAQHYNERRWMTWDLLAGKVVPGHPFWQRLCGYGLERRLEEIAAEPCPPDVIGLNHYVTSNRFLDDRGGGALPPAGYEDLVAARVVDPPPAAIGDLAAATWDRYGLPLAVTEAHLACTREEQLRWLWQTWHGCAALQLQGIPVEAVTAWALLGAVDWCSLLTRDAGRYEPAAFDVSGTEPRITALGKLIGDLGNQRNHENRQSVAAAPGWWQRPIRFLHRPYAQAAPVLRDSAPLLAKPILITGATGTLGKALASGCELRGHRVVLTTRQELTIEDPTSVARALDEHCPWAVINAAGWVRVDEAELTEGECRTANFHGAALLAKACRDRAIHCTLFSSDLVFGNGRRSPWLEADTPSPLNAYGRSKAAAEAYVVRECPDTLVIRTAAFFSPHDAHNFAWAVEQTLAEQLPFAASAQHIVTPTFVPDLVRATLDLVVDEERGIWHLTNGDAVSWFDFARMLALELDLESALVQEATADQLGWRARRPDFAALGSSRGILMPSLTDSMARHSKERNRSRLQMTCAVI
jgi:dTDP-4-dehydrorhamnose reductase